ncbi:MAG: tyrosine-type recombinase/integrase [Candidatus Dojkabacteria bacterium]
MESLEQLNRSESTIVAYETDLSQLELYFTNQLELGDIDVEKLTTKELQSFKDAISTKFSAKTVSRKLNSMKSFFKFLHDNKLVSKDHAKPVAHPDLNLKKTRQVLSELEYRGLRDTARSNLRVYTIIELMLQLGLKIGEISRLELTHVQIKQEPKNIMLVEFGNVPTRIIELNPSAEMALKRYIPKRHKTEQDQGFVFNTKNGGHMMIRNIRSAINRMFAKAGLNDVTVNDLRNTFIVQQLENGVSPEIIAQVVGHKRVEATLKYLPLTTRTEPGKKLRLVEL